MGSILTKAFAIDSRTGKALQDTLPHSKQILDSFTGVSQYGQTLMVPPYNMEQLAQLSEAHPIHAACLEQKVADVVASGLDLKPKSDQADPRQKAAILDWWESLFDEYTSLEVIQAVWHDYETIGWGALEVARDTGGIARRLYHIPAHTLRAHRNNILFAQLRHGRIIWFKRWNTEGIYYAASGRKASEELPISKRANEVLIFKKPARRSTWYGIPTYVSAVGHIALALAARDFNIKFFDNYREPRHLIALTGLDEDIDTLMQNLEIVWKTQLKDNPHRNIVLPISGDASVTVTKMGTDINDLHFSQLMEYTDGEILVAHRVPPDRLGIVKRGFLGGQIALTVNQIYKDAVVSKSQKILETRLQRFIDVEFKRATGTDTGYFVDFQDLDITDAERDIANVINLVKANIITLNQGRIELGYEPHEPFGDMTLSEYLDQFGRAPVEASLELTQKDINDQVARRLEQVDALIEDLLSTREGDQGGG